MDLRVTPHLQAQQIIASTQQNYAQLSNLQQQAATGNRVNQPSDDPTAMVAIIASKADDNRLTTFLGNLQGATSSLNASVSALQDANDIMSQAQQLAIQGGQAGNSPADLNTMANLVNQLINRLLNDANTQRDGQYLFSGTSTGTVPFAVTSQDSQGRAEAVTYNGSTQAAQTLVSPEQSVTTLYSGSDAFQGTPGTPGAFQVLIALRDDLENAQGLSRTQLTQTLSQRIGEIQQANNGVLNAMGKQSATLESLQSLQQRLQDVQLSTRETTSSLQSADISAVAVGIQEQQNLLSLTYASAARIMNLSLLNFLQ